MIRTSSPTLNAAGTTGSYLMAGSASSMRTGPTDSWNSGCSTDSSRRSSSGPGRKDGYGSHFYLRCQDAPAEKFILRDPETRADLGDLRGSGHKSFCVGPGCTHPSGGRYEVVNDVPLLELTWAELKSLVVDPCTPPAATASPPAVARDM